MPLLLSDPRWNELLGSYGDSREVVACLKQAYEAGELTGERLDELINLVQHQGGTSTAMYAVAPHLVALAQHACPEEALSLLTHAGLIYADSDAPGAVGCPTFLLREFDATSVEAAEKLADLLPIATSFESFKWAVAALGGFLGHRKFARHLAGLDYFEGQFFHVSLDEPFPPE